MDRVFAIQIKNLNTPTEEVTDGHILFSDHIQNSLTADEFWAMFQPIININFSNWSQEAKDFFYQYFDQDHISSIYQDNLVISLLEEI